MNLEAIKSLFIDLKEVIKRDFKLSYYLLSLIFIASIVFVNYYYNLEKKHIEIYNLPGNWKSVLLYHVLYCFAIYGVIFIRITTKCECSYFKTFKFNLFLNFGVFLIALDAGFPYYQFLTFKYIQTEYYYYLHYIITDIYCIVTTFIPLFIFHYIVDKNTYYYGLQFQKKTFLLYFCILICMAPIVYLAANQTDFLNYYPRFNRAKIALDHPYRTYLLLIFEFFYSLDFISTELIFRGFMVIFLSKYVGQAIILPVAAAYCFIHFGKPYLETLSSLFGGYALGLLAYQTKNIWGGVFVHVGVALLMELFAFNMR